MGGYHWRGLGLNTLTQFCHFWVRTLGSRGPIRSVFYVYLNLPFLRTYHYPVDPDGFAGVKNGWIPLEGTRTE